jgi:hypothetical protein
MATVIPPPVRSRSFEEYQRRVRSPLERLRGYIRAYVGLESAALLTLFLALWFWIGFALDWGFFKLFDLDWVQEMPWQVRAVILVILSASALALVAILLFSRLVREFADAALALVLEKRFPKLLGDRLITAVELADPRKAEALGYSGAMLQETVHEAAERVEQVPVKQAFNWRRLIRRGVLCAVLTLGLYLVVGGLFWAADSAYKVSRGRLGFSRFNETAWIWVERNIFLQNTIWPRRAMVEIIGPPETDKRLNNEFPKAPQLRVRATKYAIAGAPTAAAAAKYEAWLKPRSAAALKQKDQEAARKLAAFKKERTFSLELLELYDAGLGAQGVGGEQRKAQVDDFEQFDLFKKKVGAEGGWAAVEATLDKGLEAASARWAQDGDAEFQRRVANFKNSPPEGWRPLTWFDLRADLLGVPAEALKEVDAPTDPAQATKTAEVLAAWEPRNLDAGLSIDEIELKLDKQETHATLPSESETALREAIAKVQERSALPEMSRTMRTLEVPDKIWLTSRGVRTYMRNPLTKGADNEYVGAFGEIKESIGYRVQAEDYYSSARRLTLVPPPTLVKLDDEEYHPACLYYRVSGDAKLKELTGKKQHIESHSVLQAGSETTKIEVPFGTDLTLTAKADKDLKKVELAAPKNADPLVQTAELDKDKRTFTIAFNNVRKEIVFDCKFTDVDDVEGKRKIVIKPMPDAAPSLPEARVEIVRKINVKSGAGEESFYVVTKKARIPFMAKIDNDHGLTEVRYRYSIELEKAGLSEAVAAVYNVPAVGLLAPTLGSGVIDGQLMAAGYVEGQQMLAARAADPDAGRHDWRYYSLPTFAEALRVKDAALDRQPAVDEAARLKVEQQREFLPMTRVWELLGQPKQAPYRRLLHDFNVKPDRWNADPEQEPLGCDFPLWKEKEMQFLDDSHPHYRMYLSVEAADNDAEGGLQADGLLGRIGRSKETFPFLIVPENELLAYIGQEEVEQYKLLYAKYNELELKDKTLETTVLGLPSGDLRDVRPQHLEPPLKRAEEILTSLETSVATARSVLGNYERMLREEQLNQVRSGNFEKMDSSIVKPLGAVVRDDFDPTQQAIEKFRSILDDVKMPMVEKVPAAREAGRIAKEKMDKLVFNLDQVLKAMAGVIGKAELVDKLHKIQKDLESQELFARLIKERNEDKLFKP